MNASQLTARLRAVGDDRYHHKHPFHLLMHEGQLTRGQLQAWALNGQAQGPPKSSIQARLGLWIGKPERA